MFLHINLYEDKTLQYLRIVVILTILMRVTFRQ